MVFMKNHNGFYAMLSRMKYIERWALMKNSDSENICEHSLDVAVLAHGLAMIGVKRLGKTYNPERIALLGIYHDCTEILTGDMPTPIKYYNEEIRDAYKQIEEKAAGRLLSMLPDDLRDEYKKYFLADEISEEEESIVKAADKLSALIKCMKEGQNGNQEFSQARISTFESLKMMNCEEADIFCREFLPEYEKTLDELS